MALSSLYSSCWTSKRAEKDVSGKDWTDLLLGFLEVGGGFGCWLTKWVRHACVLPVRGMLQTPNTHTHTHTHTLRPQPNAWVGPWINSLGRALSQSKALSWALYDRKKATRRARWFSICLHAQKGWYAMQNVLTRAGPHMRLQLPGFYLYVILFSN